VFGKIRYMNYAGEAWGWGVATHMKRIAQQGQRMNGASTGSWALGGTGTLCWPAAFDHACLWCCTCFA
jgi:hypothetical protein